MSNVIEFCDHKPVWIGQVALSACARCQRVDWLSESGSVDHAEAIAAVFGSFDLVGSMDALAAPAPKVLAYAPPSKSKRRHLDALPRRTWLKAGPQLWLSHDGELLLLATTHELLFNNITRGA
jgi:hypothetical protein